VYLLDVNVLVGAMRVDSPRHATMRRCVEALRNAPEPFGLCEPVLSGALRVLTHPRAFAPPTPLPLALAFIRALRGSPNALVLQPGPRHWQLFTSLVSDTQAVGNRIPAAWLAALAIEHSCVMLSDDTDFARFPGLSWQRPE